MKCEPIGSAIEVGPWRCDSLGVLEYSLQSHNFLVCCPYLPGIEILPRSNSRRRISSEMADLAEEQLSEQFQHDSCAFLEWFTAAKGTRMSPKLELADLRASAAGRGVGKISYRCRFHHILILFLQSCQSRHR